jgi:hypothetical protein
MNFANYFKDKDSTGITLTACYEISAPINADIADKLRLKLLRPRGYYQKMQMRAVVSQN